MGLDYGLFQIFLYLLGLSIYNSRISLRLNNRLLDNLLNFFSIRINNSSIGCRLDNGILHSFRNLCSGRFDYFLNLSDFLHNIDILWALNFGFYLVNMYFSILKISNFFTGRRIFNRVWNLNLLVLLNLFDFWQIHSFLNVNLWYDFLILSLLDGVSLRSAGRVRLLSNLFFEKLLDLRVIQIESFSPDSVFVAVTVIKSFIVFRDLFTETNVPLLHSRRRFAIRLLQGCSFLTDLRHGDSFWPFEILVFLIFPVVLSLISLDFNWLVFSAHAEPSKRIEIVYVF